jgi:hypothetical protein
VKASGRSVSNLISELAAADAHQADAAGRALLTRGSEILPDLLTRYASTPVPVRRRLAFLLGRFAADGELDSHRRSVLIAALRDEDWKVRRNAAVSLGRLAHREAAEPLLARLAIEDHEAVRPSLFLALGRTASADRLPTLRQIAGRSDKEREAAVKMIDSIMGRSGIRARIIEDQPVARDVVLELWTRDGVADIAANEANAAGLDAAVVTRGRVRLRARASFSDLFRVRSALFPVIVLESGRPFDDPRGTGRQFASSAAAAALRALTTGKITYRLTVAAASDRWPRRRDWIREFVRACPDFENKATAYAWDVIVRPTGRTTIVGARPAAVANHRFAYRLRDIPASIHPTLAAAAVRLVVASPDDVVVDPFCGSGTLLAERAILGPYRMLQGIDNQPQAIDAATTNLQGLTSVELICDDAAALAELPSPHVIVTNPPYGRRIGGEREARALHLQLDELARRVLQPGGHLVVFRPPKFDTPNGLTLVSRHQVDAGGIAVDLIVARQKSA